MGGPQPPDRQDDRVQASQRQSAEAAKVSCSKGERPKERQCTGSQSRSWLVMRKVRGDPLPANHHQDQSFISHGEKEPDTWKQAVEERAVRQSEGEA